jgi:phosphoglycolate phosphatase
MQKHRIKLLVFDWDGTLADSAALIVDAMQAAIGQLQYQPRSDAQIRDIIGLGLVEAAQILFPGMEREDHKQIGDCYRLNYAKRAHETSLFQDVPDTLRILQERGYRMAIATGKSRKGLDNILRQTGLEGVFHTTRCADETRSKPHPQMLHEILKELDIQPDHAVMIGDSEYDMEMALNAGVSPLAVSYGVHDSTQLLKYKPLTCLASLSDLLDWLPAAH